MYSELRLFKKKQGESLIHGRSRSNISVLKPEGLCCFLTETKESLRNSFV